MITKRNKKIMPHTFVVLFILVLLASILTYFIPAGNFKRVTDETIGQTIVVADSYERVTKNPIAPWMILHKFYEAISQPNTASLMFFILIIGGTFEIILKTGCMMRLCESMLIHLKNKELWIIPIFVFLFSIFGFTMGLTTASIIFVPIGIAVANTLGIDKMVGMAMVALGTNAGFTAGVFNPFSVGVAQTIAEVPLYSGAWLRWIVLIVLNLVTSLYLVRYAKKHRFDKKEYGNNVSNHNETMTTKQRIALVEFVITFVILTIGISRYGWKIEDIVVTFLIMGLVIGISSGFGINKTCDIFIEGCKKMMKGVLVIGIAATIRLILTQGNILDTITYELTQLVYQLPKVIQLLGIFLFNAIINILITSGSAKAALVMPIFTPMADFLLLSRQSAVFAFQLGDGVTNLASPISTTLNGVLAVSEETYEKWIRFYFPLVLLYVLVGGVFTVFAGWIAY